MTDKTKSEYKECFAVMGTLTNAQKAQRALSVAAIPSIISKSDPAQGHKGCVWGIEFPCNQSYNVQSIFSSYGISVREWRGG